MVNSLHNLKEKKTSESISSPFIQFLIIKTVAHISVGEVPVWPLSVRHDLPHYHAVAPNITGGGELPVGNGLRGCPADWDFPTLPGTWQIWFSDFVRQI